MYTLQHYTFIIYRPCTSQTRSTRSLPQGPNPASQVLDSLGLTFDSWNMTVSLTPEKLTDVQDLVSTWSAKCLVTLPELRSLLGKLLYVAQVCHSAHLFLNRMLQTLR